MCQHSTFCLWALDVERCISAVNERRSRHGASLREAAAEQGFYRPSLSGTASDPANWRESYYERFAGETVVADGTGRPHGEREIQN